MLLSMWLGSACGCVRWVGMPELPKGTANDTALYGVSNKKWSANVNSARAKLRAPEAGFDWRLAGTAGEQLARFGEVREKFAGVIFVGDSQIREVSWAALKLLAPTEELRFDETDQVFGRRRKTAELEGSCVPQSVGKTGFTAECRGGVCRMHSPWHNSSHAEAMRKLLLTRPHDWDGSLSLTEAACTSDFFVSYQAASLSAQPAAPLCLGCSPVCPGLQPYVLRMQPRVSKLQPRVPSLQPRVPRRRGAPSPSSRSRCRGACTHARRTTPSAWPARAACASLCCGSWTAAGNTAGSTRVVLVAAGLATCGSRRPPACA